ncbi:MAG: mammalian cell entry protein, partial [Nocardia sp.]|nr:mammalian cell entry protein [Nocardia sp.]
VRPGLPALPGLPAIPGLPAAPASAPVHPASAQPTALRGPEAVAAIVGGIPDMAQLLMLGPVVAGGQLQITDDAEGAGA